MAIDKRRVGSRRQATTRRTRIRRRRLWRCVLPEYREIVASQSGQIVTRWLGSRIRKPRQIDAELPEPDRPALRAAEQLMAERGPGPIFDPDGPAPDPSGPLFTPNGLFDSVEDREPAKVMMQAALQAPRPVHVLLVGDPASGKSDLLRCCADSIPRARYAVGGMTTSSGIVDYLLERPGTSIVLIDELDKADPGDYAALYELMESGQVPRLQHGKTEVLRWRGRVFAAANETDRIPQALLSRFRIVRLEPYTREQLATINRVVAQREGVSAKRADEIADLMAERSTDPRDARDLARLAGESGELGPLMEQVSAPKPVKSR
jgi:hypothetical protein